MTFNANQSGEECGGLISDGDQEITFVLSWNYVETIYESNNSRNTVDDDDGNQDRQGSKGKESSDVVAVTILSILILSLLIYLAVMMKKQDYSEEE